MNLTPLEQSLNEDIAAEQATLEPSTEKSADDIAGDVGKQLEESDHGTLEKEAPIEGEQEGGEAEEELPENPTSKDFARMRVQLKEKEKELQRAREESARKEGYLAAKSEAGSTANVQKEQVDPEPDFNEDPKNWMVWNQRQTDKKIESIENNYRMKEVRNQVEQVITQSKSAEDSYIKENPQYKGAKDFLTNIVAEDFRKKNPMATDEQIEVMVRKEEYAAILHAKQSNLNPVFYFEMLAKTAGYKPAPVDAPKQEEKVAEKIEKKPNMEAIKRNREKTPSLVGTRSNAGSIGEPTDEEIADLTLSQMAAMGR